MLTMHANAPIDTLGSLPEQGVIYWDGLELEGWDDVINLLEEAWVRKLLAYRILFYPYLSVTTRGLGYSMHLDINMGQKRSVVCLLWT